jgi:hypothetical protein
VLGHGLAVQAIRAQGRPGTKQERTPKLSAEFFRACAAANAVA